MAPDSHSAVGFIFPTLHTCLLFRQQNQTNGSCSCSNLQDLTKRISFTSTAQTRLQTQDNTGSGETNTLKEGSSTLIQCRDNPPAAISQRIDCIDQTSGAKSTPTRHTSPIDDFILPRASKVWRDVTPHPTPRLWVNTSLKGSFIKH